MAERGERTIRVAAAVRAARGRLGWSRETLAHESGLSWSAITQIETGRRSDVRVSSLVALAGALGVSLDYLALASGEPASKSGPMLSHRAFMYRSENDLAQFASDFLGSQEEPQLSLVVAPQPQLNAIREELGGAGGTVEFRDSAAWYTTPAEVCERYRSFFRSAQAVGSTWTRVIGEPVWPGRSQADIANWMRYESILNLAFASWPVTLVCPYDARTASRKLIADACRTHPELATPDGTVTSSNYETPERFVASAG